MLSNSPQSIRPSTYNWARISLILVGLMWAFPFLHYRHENPLTSFDQEWWSAMLGVLAVTLLIAREFWERPEIPRIAQLPALLIVVLLVQLALGRVAYFGQALLYSLYFLFATLLMMLGAKLRDCFGLARVTLFRSKGMAFTIVAERVTREDRVKKQSAAARAPCCANALPRTSACRAAWCPMCAMPTAASARPWPEIPASISS